MGGQEQQGAGLNSGISLTYSGVLHVPLKRLVLSVMEGGVRGAERIGSLGDVVERSVEGEPSGWPGPERAAWFSVLAEEVRPLLGHADGMHLVQQRLVERGVSVIDSIAFTRELVGAGPGSLAEAKQIVFSDPARAEERARHEVFVGDLVTALSPSDGVAGAVGSGLESPEQAWAFVREFAAAFARPLAVGDGVDPEELAAAETALGFGVPQPLRAAFSLFGRRRDLTSMQDQLLPPGRLSVDESGEVLVFRVESEGCASWGVPLAGLDVADPPVVVDAGEGWQPFMERLSLACVEMVLSEVTLSAHRRANACELPPELLSKITSEWARVAFPDYPNWVSAEDSPIRWYAAPGQLMRVDGPGPWPWMYACGQTEVDLERICLALPARWSIGYE